MTYMVGVVEPFGYCQSRQCFTHVAWLAFCMEITRQPLIVSRILSDISFKQKKKKEELRSVTNTHSVSHRGGTSAQNMV